MAIVNLDKTVHGTVAAITATASATAAPSVSTDGFQTVRYPRVRTLLAYAGTVDTCEVRVWFRDRNTGIWYKGASTEEFDALVPGGASAVNDSRDWEVGRHQEIFYQVAAVTGGGTVAVRLQPIDTGARA